MALNLTLRVLVLTSPEIVTLRAVRANFQPSGCGANQAGWQVTPNLTHPRGAEPGWSGYLTLIDGLVMGFYGLLQLVVAVGGWFVGCQLVVAQKV